MPGESAGSDQPTAALTSWAGRVGTRRLAALALDEGEMLALRLPREALPLLATARVAFQRAGDLIGAGQAAVLAGLAALRLDTPFNGWEALEAAYSDWGKATGCSGAEGDGGPAGLPALGRPLVHLPHAARTAGQRRSGEPGAS